MFYYMLYSMLYCTCTVCFIIFLQYKYVVLYVLLYVLQCVLLYVLLYVSLKFFQSKTVNDKKTRGQKIFATRILIGKMKI